MLRGGMSMNYGGGRGKSGGRAHLAAVNLLAMARPGHNNALPRQKND